MKSKDKTKMESEACGGHETAHAGWSRLATQSRWAMVATHSGSGGMPSSGLALFCAISDASGGVKLALPLAALGSQGDRLTEDGRVSLLIADERVGCRGCMPLRAVVEGRATIAEADSDEADQARRCGEEKFSTPIAKKEERWALVSPWGATVWDGAERLGSLDAEQLGVAAACVVTRIVAR